MNRLALIAIAVLFTFAIVAINGTVFSRIDRARADARAAQQHAAAVRAELTSVIQHQRGVTVDLGSVRAEIALCRRRTESLRGVLDVLIPSGICPERVRLPDPPPGWAPWPRLGGTDQPGGNRDGE